MNSSPDGPIMVTWKTMPIVIGFVIVLIVVCAGTPSQQRIAIWSALVIVAAVWLYFIVRVAWRFGSGGFKPHPANQIAPLIMAGRNDEAYAVAMECLREFPNDPMVQLNTVAALHVVGRKTEAMDLFGKIDQASLTNQMQPLYDHWQRQLS